MTIYLDLIFNLAMLVALSIVSGFIERRWVRGSRQGMLLQGVLFGATAVVGMLYPLNLGPGLIFDGRSIVVSLCALFFGPWAAAVAGGMAIVCRIGLGGAGTTMGVLVVLSSAAIGLLGHFRFKPDTHPPSTGQLYFFGIAVHIAMLALTLTLPEDAWLGVLRRIGLPVMLMYPLATILAGKILSDQVAAIRTLADLQSSKEHLAITLRSIGDALISTDRNGRIVFMNHVAETLTGWTEAEARGNPLATVFHIVNEETGESVENPVAKVLRERVVVDLANHTQLIARDGTRLPIADSAAPIRDGSNEITGVVLVFRDQTGERQAMRMTQTRLALIEYAATHPLGELLTRTLDEIGTLVDSPIGFYHFVEADQKTLSLQQWSTRTLKDFCRADGKGMHYPLEQAGVWSDCARLKKPTIHNDYESLQHKQGLPEGHAQVVRELVVPVMREGRVVAIVGVGNKPVSYTESDMEMVSFLADVTWELVVHKRMEEERKKLLSQFQQAQKMESIGRLAGGVAHDYNNILSVIFGYTELALDKVDPSEPLHDDLMEILTAARRSAAITRQLLAFARKQTIAPKVLDINEIVENMLKMLHRLIGEDIDLAWLPESDVWPVKIDPSQVEQILANLCVNARDAIGGVGKVTIETHTITLDNAYCAEHAGFVPGKYVLLAVSDDGCGIDKETLGNIFEPFFTTKEVNQGTGLGLATVYGIVKQNNGFINVYSEPGKGTTFRIYLPRHAGKAEQTGAQVTEEIQTGHGERVLLVEDETAIRVMVQMMLERLGYGVLAAATPGEALHLAKDHPDNIALLITDVVMPEMNGRDLANRLHSLYPDIKILFMSGYTANVIAHRGVLDEGVQFIQKPFSLRDLAAKVRTVLDPK